MKTFINKINKEKIINILKDFFINNLYILYMALPFFLMDIITRLFGKSIKFYQTYKLPPNLFTICWIILFIGLSLSFKKKIGKKIYLFTSITFLIMFLVNNVYFSITNTFFDFNLLQSATEGAPYIIDTLINKEGEKAYEGL